MRMENHTPTWIARLHLATAFLTWLPLPEVCMDLAGSLSQAMALFPVVGAAIGAFGGLLFAIANHFLLPLPSALISLAAMAAVTGALHEDGLADFADGLGARGDKDARLAVMRDPHTGVYGLLALGFSVLIKAALLSSAPGAGSVFAALIAAGALSRAAIPALMRTLPPARSDGLGATAGIPDFGDAATGAVIAALLSLFAIGFGATFWALAMAAAAAATVVYTAKKSLGGFTGDVLGATQQVVELFVLMAVASRW